MAYYDDADTSRAELEKLLDAMVKGGTIARADADGARLDIEAAYRDADEASYFGKDARTFWTSLAGRVNARAGWYASWGNGKKSAQTFDTAGQRYANVVLSGLSAYDSARATEYASSWNAFWEKVVVQTAVETGEAAKTASERVTSPWYIWGMAALVLGVVILKTK
jgi:hypothetical protein